MKVRIWVDENRLARIFDPTDMTVRVCTPEEAAEDLTGRRSRTSTKPIDNTALEKLIEESAGAPVQRRPAR
jgi:hypothetical protein